MKIAQVYSQCFALLLANCQTFASPIVYPDCIDVETFYADMPNSSDRALVHNFLRSSHRGKVPYSSPPGKADTWSALIDVDPENDTENPSFALENATVHLVYADYEFPAVPYGNPTDWDREHSWPQSRGVAGIAKTDLHALFSAMWGLNSSRGKKYYGDVECSAISSGKTSFCKSPAHEGSAYDTGTDNLAWMPPANMRGDLARALLYMDVRYDGDEGENVPDLVLTDCPSDSGEGATNMGFLSDLLRWHASDPVDNQERIRNEKICSRYQGNRNMFVDFPEMVEKIFGEPAVAIDKTAHVYPGCFSEHHEGVGGLRINSKY